MFSAQEAHLKSVKSIYDHPTLGRIVRNIEETIKEDCQKGYMCTEFGYTGSVKLTDKEMLTIRRFLESYEYEVTFMAKDGVLWIGVIW